MPTIELTAEDLKLLQQMLNTVSVEGVKAMEKLVVLAKKLEEAST